MLHVVALALLVTMILLGRWQLVVSEERHFRLQNFGYALQWWAFTVFAAYMWVRLIRDARRQADAPGTESGGSQDAEAAGRAAPEVAYRRYVMPQSATSPAPSGDSLNAAYNEYLAELARDSADGADGADSERTTR